MLRYTVREEHRRIQAEDYLRSFVDVPRFHVFCRTCPCYDRNWACPEFDFDPLTVWSRYRWLHLTAFWIEFAPDQPRSGFEPSALIEDVLAMHRHEKRHAHRRLMSMRAASPDSFPLGVGECLLCTECTRSQGLPCRIPDQLVHSIESLGGDVEATMRVLFGHTLQWSDGRTLPDRYLHLIGLLCDRAELPEVAPAPDSGRDHSQFAGFFLDG